jgi:hypothetical protein
MNSGEKLDDAWGVDRALQRAIRSLPFGGRYPPERAVVLENSMGDNALHHDSRNQNKKEKASVIER